MKLQQGAGLVEIAQIKVLPERQRSAGFKTDDLEVSIRKLGGGRLNEGLLQPIIINFAKELQIGERRLTACRNLGHTHILARFAESLSQVESKIIELAENLYRVDLAWEDRVRSVAEIHALFLSQDPEWTMTETAEEISLTQGTVSMYLSVHSNMDNERVAKAGTVREAYNVLQRRDQRRAGNQLEDLLSTPDMVEEEEESVPQELSPAQIDSLHVPPDIQQGLARAAPLRIISREVPQILPPEESILHQSFLDWAPKYSGPKFNLVHFDPPYGVGLGSGPQGRGTEEAIYDDTPEIYWQLLACFCGNLDRFMSVAGHLMLWLSADMAVVEATRAFLAKRAPSLSFHKFPLIWLKTDNAGIAADPKMGPRHVYETCLLASRSQRQIVQIKADGYASQSDRALHPSSKPEPMLRHFMTMLVDETTSLLDPTCGSGSSLRAAESLGAKRVLGLEISKGYVEAARMALKHARSKAAVSKTLKESSWPIRTT